MATGGSPPGSSGATDTSTSTLQHARTDPLTPEMQGRQKWKFHLRPDDDDQPQDWWFCSTAIPLLAATTGPHANVMSIAALVTSWRNNYNPANPGIDADSTGFPDPRWCLGLNGASLACGFAGNIFLLFNFTKRIRYIVALPVTIILWYFATGIVCHCLPLHLHLSDLFHHYTVIFRHSIHMTSFLCAFCQVLPLQYHDTWCEGGILLTDNDSSSVSPHPWTSTCLPTDPNRPIVKAFGTPLLLPFFTSSHR